MRKQAGMVQYTVRGVPREVDVVLRRRAAQHKVSLNQTIVEELSEAAIGARRRADFSDLVGKWTPDAAFDEVLAAGRQIDRDKWK
jgi:plasmid stability protein